MRPALGQTPAARTAFRALLLAVTSTTVAAGVMAGTASASGRHHSSAPPFFAGLVAQSVDGHQHNHQHGAHHGDQKFIEVVKVFNSATGATAGTLTIPGASDLTGLSRLGDGQTFVAASFDRGACVSQLWKFSIDQAGQPSSPTSLPDSQMRGDVSGLTSSADGNVLAVELSPCRHGDRKIRVIHLDTGQVTRWHDPSFAGSMSLTADGSRLGFEASQDPSADSAQAWTIRTSAPSGPLLDHARRVPGLGANVDQMILSPSGDQIYIEAQTPGQPASPVTLSVATTRTGTLIKQIAQIGPGGKDDPGFAMLAMDAAGRNMLAYGSPSGGGFAGVNEIGLRSGHSHRLTVTNPVIDGGLDTFAW